MRSSIAFCTSLFADRSGVAASRILLVAAPCVILLCFAAESCKSHCNGGVKVANPALAANFLVNRIVMAASVFDFGNIKLSFQCPFNFEFDSIKFSFSISCLEDFLSESTFVFC